jgi:hypothetical protein
MFDTNTFKRSIKEWIRENPKASVEELTDFCEELIPSQQFVSHGWLVEQTVGWYEHVLNSRRHLRAYNVDEEE